MYSGTIMLIKKNKADAKKSKEILHDFKKKFKRQFSYIRCIF